MVILTILNVLVHGFMKFNEIWHKLHLNDIEERYLLFINIVTHAVGQMNPSALSSATPAATS